MPASLTLDQARAEFVSSLRCELSVETVALENALGRIVADEIVAAHNVPAEDNSAMDGFAVHTDSFSERQVPFSLPVSLSLTAGEPKASLATGTAARIFTGAVIPNGANAVVIQENCRYQTPARSVEILKLVTAAENIRPAGQDIVAGAPIIDRKTRLNPIHLGLLASVGCAQVEVYQPLRVALLTTGDELREPGSPLASGQIYNSNAPMLSALLAELGCQVLSLNAVADTLDATVQALTQASEGADLVISCGGVSVGDEDHVKSAVARLGAVKHWKIQMKPGKPVAFGQVQSTPFLGLPGNPVSAFVVFHVLGMAIVECLQGAKVSDIGSQYVAAGFAKGPASREEFLRVRMNNESETNRVEPYANQSSGVLSSLSWADGLVRQRIGQSIEDGDLVEYLPFSWRSM